VGNLALSESFLIRRGGAESTFVTGVESVVVAMIDGLGLRRLGSGDVGGEVADIIEIEIEAEVKGGKRCVASRRVGTYSASFHRLLASTFVLGMKSGFIVTSIRSENLFQFSLFSSLIKILESFGVQ